MVHSRSSVHSLTANPRSLRWIPPALALAAVLAGCGSEPAGGAAGDGLPSAAERARTQLALREVFRTDESLSFTNVTGLDVDSRGRVYVADWAVPSIAVLDPEGRLERRIGRRGEGPGEFANVGGVQVLSGDSVQVFDLQLNRLTVFAPGSDEVAYVAPTAARAGYASQVTRVAGSDRLLALFRQAFSPRDNPAEDARRNDVVRVVSLSGAVVRDSVAVFPSPGTLVLRNGGAVSVTRHPWGRRGVVRLGSDGRVYRVWTDTVGVEVLSLDGEVLDRWAVPATAPPIGRDDVERALLQMGPRAQQWRRSVEQAAEGRWPAVSDFVLDDRGRAWLALGAPEDAPVEWLVFDGSGGYEASVILAPRSSILRVAAGRVYVAEKDELDVPRIVAYAIG